MSERVTVQWLNDHLVVLKINRPDAANALSMDVLTQINIFIKEFKANTNIRCLIITGAGNKAFCAGADLKERKGMTEEQVIDTVRYIGETITNIESLQFPVIAAINGVALGGGLELALACDIRFASEHAKMGLTETSLAIIPGAGGTQRLPRLIGIGQAKRLIYTAERIDADEALRIGLVEHIVSSDQLMDNAITMANKITKNGPIALKQAKIAINMGVQADIHTGLSIEHLCYKETLHTTDRLEGLAAFKEKRNPIYKGK
ncbi:enoyl-CoA hydratase [Virgibacillus sp. W0430]|uniref:enoyl-CoA hydratase n=1 Tax=Virgibacillus sp. W0430 TaxID=3391580 RepID=UPI003F4591A1